jgi:alanyl-tRNA synthetase
MARGVKAGQLVGEVAKMVDGRGGGRPDFARAGGKNSARLPEALTKVDALVAEALK